MPVLEGALERAVDLAAAMDSRGYGRTGTQSTALRRTSGALLLLGLVGMCLGVYALLDTGTAGALGLPLLVVGVAAGTIGVLLAGRRSIRTRYRPDPWALPEWIVAATGVIVAAVLVAVRSPTPRCSWGLAARGPRRRLPVAAILLAALPGLVTPLPPGMMAGVSMPVAGPPAGGWPRSGSRRDVTYDGPPRCWRRRPRGPGEQSSSWGARLGKSTLFAGQRPPRTSPAAPSPAASSSPGGTPARIPRASSPTSWARSCRTR
jgi:hypothetical protein